MTAPAGLDLDLPTSSSVFGAQTKAELAWGSQRKDTEKRDEFSRGPRAGGWVPRVRLPRGAVPAQSDRCMPGWGRVGASRAGRAARDQQPDF